MLDGDVMEVEPFLKDNISLLQEQPNNTLLREVINSRSYELTTSMYYWDYSWGWSEETWNRRLWACILQWKNHHPALKDIDAYSWKANTYEGKIETVAMLSELLLFWNAGSTEQPLPQ